MQHEAGLLLLVDGNVHRAERLRGSLVALGFEVRLADNGAVGLLKAHERRPDAALVAAELPILDGYRMLDALRSQPQTCDIPVILLTEGNSNRELVRGWSAGADLCVPCNSGEAEVLVTLRRALMGLRQTERAQHRQAALVS
jgi:DNA-binding response OmpR family regulator